MPFFSPVPRNAYVIAGALAAILDPMSEGCALRLMKWKAGAWVPDSFMEQPISPDQDFLPLRK